MEKGYVNSNWTRVCRSMLENGGSVVLTSGINGANTRTQRERGIKDSGDLFTSDTLKGGAKKPELAKVLCEDSLPVVFAKPKDRIVAPLIVSITAADLQD